MSYGLQDRQTRVHAIIFIGISEVEGFCDSTSKCTGEEVRAVTPAVHFRRVSEDLCTKFRQYDEDGGRHLFWSYIQNKKLFFANFYLFSSNLLQ